MRREIDIAGEMVEAPDHGCGVFDAMGAQQDAFRLCDGVLYIGAGVFAVQRQDHDNVGLVNAHTG
ncbi:hypothetical protein ACQ86N_25610 [Puia sp. P3]|uniref:hypothetical protein n=1 Tax=Puia sp. P3 TaxID=3423952 RepID=UPI003D676B4D